MRICLSILGAVGLLSGSFSRAVAEGAPVARISVEPSTVVRVIPNSLFGSNLEWIWNGDLVWRGSSVDPGYAALIKEAGVSLYRFPGGLFSDFYDWRNGVGPQDKRPYSPSLPGGAVSSNAFGTDEALTLAKTLNGKLLITVNAGTGSAESAADWVRYVNIDRAGHVDYWEIGNELYIPAQSIGSIGIISMTAEQYAARLIQYAKAMKGVDPTIRIGAILDESLNSIDSGWTRTVLLSAADYIDFVSVHNAYAPVLPQPYSADVHSVYQALLAGPTLIARNLKSLSERLDTLVPSRAGRIPIAITEWGAFYQVDPASPYIDHVKTLGSALYTASTLMTFIRSPRTTIANHFKLSDPLYMGMIGLRDDKPAATASLFAMEMMTKHIGSQLLASSVVSPVYSEAGAGNVGPMANIPVLDAIATLSEDGAHCFITAVNKDLDSPVHTTISLGDMRVKSTATIWTLAGTGIDANTGTAPPAGYLRTKEMEWLRFSKGGPAEVTLSSATMNNVDREFTYDVPPASVISIDISLACATPPPGVADVATVRRRHVPSACKDFSRTSRTLSR